MFHTEKKFLKRIIMGRIARKGFEYYRAETDRFRDIKIRKLRKEHSCAGYAIYQYVLNEIYRVEGCYIRFTQDELFDCAEYWNMREEEVLRIINYCTETGLFNAGIWKQYGILTGHSIQIRYVSMCHAAKRKTVIPEEINLLSEEKSSFPVSRAQLPVEAASVPICGSVAVTSVPFTEPSEAPVPLKEGILPEKTGFIPEESVNIPEAYNIKERKENISSSSSFTSVQEKTDEEDNSIRTLKSDLEYLNLKDDQIRWACILKARYPAMPLEYAIAAVKDSIRNGDYRYSVGGCLTPLIENYIRKYNAECSGEKRQDGFLAALERLGISPAQQHEILHLSADSPRVLEAALKEIERSNGRIRSPLCFLRSRLTSVRTA